MQNAVMDVVFNLSTTVRTGWAAWLAWVVLQWGWYRYAATTTAAARTADDVGSEGASDDQVLSLRPFLQSPEG